MTIKEALNWATKELKKAKIESARLEAEILLCYAQNSPTLPPRRREGLRRGFSRIWLYQNPTYNLQPTTYNFYKNLIARRKKHEPIAYLTHHKEFFGLDFWVDRNVLIPRPETELLVEEGLLNIKNKISKIKNTNEKCKNIINIIDVGTGSGCIIIAIAKKLKIKNKKLKIKFYATDISKKALKVANKNAKFHKVDNKIRFLHGDLLKPFFKIQDLKSKIQNLIIVANLPYLTSKIYHLSPSLHYEPKIALDGGKNSLNLYRRFFKQLSVLISIKPASICTIIEIDPTQTEKIKQLARKYLSNYQISIKKDLAGRNRVVLIKQ